MNILKLIFLFLLNKELFDRLDELLLLLRYLFQGLLKASERVHSLGLQVPANAGKALRKNRLGLRLSARTNHLYLLEIF
jgi:hypothetical protein